MDVRGVESSIAHVLKPLHQVYIYSRVLLDIAILHKRATLQRHVRTLACSKQVIEAILTTAAVDP